MSSRPARASSGPRGAARGSERRCRGPSAPSTRVSPLATGQRSPTRPTWSFRRASSGERQRGGTGAKRKENRRGWRGAPRGPVPPGETAPCVGGPSGGEQGGRQRTPPPPQHRLHDGAEGRGPRPTLGPGSCSEGGTRRFSYARKEAQMVVILGKIQF